MAETQATIGYGSAIAVATIVAPTVFTEMGEVTSLTPAKFTRDTADASHMRSPGGYAETIPKMKQPGECSFEGNFIPGSATDVFIKSWFDTNEIRNCKIEYPNGSEETFAASVTGYEKTDPVDDKMTYTCTLKVTGAVTYVEST